MKCSYCRLNMLENPVRTAGLTLHPKCAVKATIKLQEYMRMEYGSDWQRGFEDER